MAASINLFLAPLDKRVDDDTLKREFEKFGDIISAAVIKDETGDSKSFGFIHFKSMSDGLRAREEMNGKIFFSKTLGVEIANSQDCEKYLPRSGKTIWADDWQDKAKSELHTRFSEFQESDTSADEKDTSVALNVLQRNRKLFNDQLYTDVVFYPKNNPAISISAHRALLAVGSPLFAQMLFGDQSSNCIGEKIKVQISNVSFEAFSSIVKYIYTDEICLESDDLVQEIFEGAKEFQILGLIDQCKSHLEYQQLTVENVCSQFQMSITNKLNVLKIRCIEYIQKNTAKIIRSTDFQKCSAETVYSICMLNSFNLRSEAEMFEAVMSWLNSQSLTNKQLRVDLLEGIRLLTFSVAEFSHVIRKYPDLLSTEEALQIMMYLSNPPRVPDFKKLPSWCNRNTKSRCLFVGNPRNSLEFLNLLDDRGNDQSPGRIIFPLKESFDCQNVTELTSLLEMKCIAGHHHIYAIKLAFQGPVNDASMIKSLSITVRVHPSGFKTYENIEIANSLEIRVAFTKIIKARRGDIINIELEAKDIKGYTFLQFDATRDIPPNRHFQCSVGSKPRVGRLFFLSEVEYGPQTLERTKGNWRFDRGKQVNFS